MKKLEILIDGALYALYMLFSCLVSMLAEMFIVRVITLFVGMDYFTLCLLRALIYTVLVNGILAIAAYRDGYKTTLWRPVHTGISGAVALVLHFVFCLLFSFEAFCAGSVKFITALVKFGPALSLESFQGSLDRFDCIGIFFLNGLVYIAVIILAKRLGISRRLADREDMTGSALPKTETTED